MLVLPPFEYWVTIRLGTEASANTPSLFLFLDIQ